MVNETQLKWFNETLDINTWSSFQFLFESESSKVSAKQPFRGILKRTASYNFEQFIEVYRSKSLFLI